MFDYYSTACLFYLGNWNHMHRMKATYALEYTGTVSKLIRSTQPYPIISGRAVENRLCTLQMPPRLSLNTPSLKAAHTSEEKLLFYISASLSQAMSGKEYHPLCEESDWGWAFPHQPNSAAFFTSHQTYMPPLTGVC